MRSLGLGLLLAGLGLAPLFWGTAACLLDAGDVWRDQPKRFWEDIALGAGLYFHGEFPVTRSPFVKYLDEEGAHYAENRGRLTRAAREAGLAPWEFWRTVPDETYRYEGPHLSEYDRTKWIAHYRVALPKIEDGLPLSIVMPGLVYGPGDTSGMRTALVDLLRGRLPITPARTAFCWAHVEDTARGHILAMEQGKPGETYIITGPRHTFEEAFDLVATLAGVPKPLLHPGPRTMRAAAAAMGVLQHVLALPPAMTPEALRTIAGTTYLGSNEKAVRELGFSARSLREGMEQTLEYELRELARRQSEK